MTDKDCKTCIETTALNHGDCMLCMSRSDYIVPRTVHGTGRGFGKSIIATCTTIEECAKAFETMGNAGKDAADKLRDIVSDIVRAMVNHD